MAPGEMRFLGTRMYRGIEKRSQTRWTQHVSGSSSCKLLFGIFGQLSICRALSRKAHYAITGTSGHISPRQHTPTPVTAQQSPDTKYTLTDTHIGPADSDSRHPSVT